MTNSRKRQRKKTTRIEGEKFPVGVGNIAYIYRTTRSGKVYQYRHWIKSEKKYFRISLHTQDRLEAQSRAEQQFLKLSGQIYSGIKVFSVTAHQQVQQSLAHQEERKKLGLISFNRLKSYKRVMGHYLKFVGENTRLGSLSIDRFREYFSFRRSYKPPPIFLTIKSEQSAIMGLWKWSIEEGFVPSTMVPKFTEFKVPAHEGKRKGIDERTYNQIVSVSKNWHRHAKTERDVYDRRILHHAILCQSWYGFRTGEILSLEWRDIKFRDDDTAVVSLRPENTKTREGRLNINRADIFRRVLEFSAHTQPTDRVFASFSNDLNPSSESTYFYRRWVELKNDVQRRYPEFDMDTDPYCFRHFWITVRLLAGDSPYDIARLVGNSLRMIETHYDQVRNEQIAQKILSKKVKFNSDGTVTVEVVKKEQ